MEVRLPRIEKLLKSMSTNPGVYMIKDEYGRIIYVGKAKNLRNRLRNHFTPSNDFAASRVIREKGKDIEVVEVSSEKEALLLEYNLIQEHKPSINSKWRDGKTYPFVEITTGEKFPRVIVTRETENKESVYLGPFSDVGAVRRSIKYILQTFPVANCDHEIHLGDAKTWAKTCIRRRTNQCLKPCEVPINPVDYREQINAVTNFLDGRLPEVQKEVENLMKESADVLEFERAAEYRDLLKSLNRTLEKQAVIIDSPDTFIVVIYKNETYFGVNVARVENNHLVQQNPVFISIEELESESSDGDIYLDFVLSTTLSIIGRDPKRYRFNRVLNATNFDSMDGILNEIGYRVVHRQANQKQVVVLLEQNLKQFIRRKVMLGKKSDFAMAKTFSNQVLDLQKILTLDEPPVIIDTFDISTLMGTNNVGSSVRFVHGKPFKKGYRRFKVRTVEGQDDFASMYEVVYRRYSDWIDSLDKFGLTLPNLIVIDGGREQLKRAKTALDELGLSIPVIGLAKKLEEVYRPNLEEPIQFDKNRPGMLLVRAGRDEAHRFAVTYQRKRRMKDGLKTLLDEISGVGEKRKSILMKEYKSLSNIAKESSETLSQRFKIPQNVASEIILRSRQFIDAQELREKRRRKFKRVK